MEKQIMVELVLKNIHHLAFIDGLSINHWRRGMAGGGYIWNCEGVKNRFLRDKVIIKL